MLIYDRDLPWVDNQEELWTLGLKVKQRLYLGCYFSLHKDEYQVKVHMRKSQPRKDSVTENEECSRRTRAVAAVWLMGWRLEARMRATRLTYN